MTEEYCSCPDCHAVLKTEEEKKSGCCKQCLVIYKKDGWLYCAIHRHPPTKEDKEEWKGLDLQGRLALEKVKKACGKKNFKTV
jgi:hypothetical protein